MAEPFFQLSYNELEEQLPGATEDQIQDAVQSLSSQLNETFAHICEDLRYEYNLVEAFTNG